MPETPRSGARRVAAESLADDPAALRRASREIQDFIAATVETADAEGVVVGLSGGLDSTVTATLAVEALGEDRVYGLVMPANKLSDTHAHDAREVASVLGIDHETVHLRPIVQSVLEGAPGVVDPEGPVAVGNLAARIRMVVAYLVANSTRRLVAGSTNRSKLLLGYVTKHGDGGVDCLPIGDLYVTEVEALARELGVPEAIVTKPSTAGFWLGQTDESDLGAPYAVVDEVLRYLGAGYGLDGIVTRTGASPETIETVATHYEATRHKRRRPPTAGVAGRSLPRE